jgi:branched-subunit amino acid transport protein
MNGDALQVWLLITATGLATFSTRLSFIALFARREMPMALHRALHHVPPAMLTALIAPALLLGANGSLNLSPDNLRLVAAVLAGFVAFHTRSTTWTIVSGMVALWLLQAAQSLTGG